MPSTTHLSTPYLVLRGTLAILFGYAACGLAAGVPAANASPGVAPKVATALSAPLGFAAIQAAPVVAAVQAASVGGAAVQASRVAVADVRAAPVEAATVQTVPAAVCVQAAPVAIAALQAAPAHIAGLGVPAGAQLLDSARGGSDGIVTNAALRGTVSGNRSTNVITGANTIQASSFAGATGIPIVIQNSGANVLIQNATVINLQFQ